MRRRWKDDYWMKCELADETDVLENRSITTWSTTNPIWFGLILNPGQLGGEPDTNFSIYCRNFSFGIKKTVADSVKKFLASCNSQENILTGNWYKFFSTWMSKQLASNVRFLAMTTFVGTFQIPVLQHYIESSCRNLVITSNSRKENNGIPS
jgi:hypothetical protein